MGPVADRCNARHDSETFIFCELDEGHDGPHEGYVTVTWDAEASDG